MKNRNQDSSQSFSYLMFASLIMLIVISLSGSAYSARFKSPKESAASAIKATGRLLLVSESSSLSTAVPEAGQRRQVEQITLQPNGFDPDEITRPEGRFVLSVQNRSGLDDVELRFGREDGNRLNVLQSRRRKLSWADEVNLPPGRYELSVATSSEWRCVITITTR
jgi:hypothetical protein